jgi:hypothetical protein
MGTNIKGYKKFTPYFANNISWKGQKDIAVKM